MTASALKKLPLQPEQEIPYTTPIKPLEIPQVEPIVSPVELASPKDVSNAIVSVRGLVGKGHSQPEFREYIPGKESRLPSQADDKFSRRAWAALNRWRTNPGEPTASAPLQPGVTIIR